MCAHIVHAAGESAQAGINALAPNTSAIVLAARNEAELRAIAQKLTENKFEHVLMRESDPPYDGQCIAIGVYPIDDRSKIKKILSSLPLLKENLMQGGSSNTSVQSQRPTPCPSSSSVEHPE